MTYEMENEIRQQPKVLKTLIGRYITADNKIAFDLPEGIKKLTFIASGSSYHCAGIVAKLFREYANIKASCEYASEFYVLKNIFVETNTLYIFISQSGETFDTVESLKKIKAAGGKTMCITNCENSSLWNLCDYKILSEAGEEKSIASTKALSAQLLCLYLVMLKFLKTKGNDITKEICEIRNLPEFVDAFLADVSQVKEASKLLAATPNAVLLGTKYYYSLAKEGALKIKETSYIDANAYPQGEFLHGHMAVLNNKPLLVAIAVDEAKDSMKTILGRVFKDYSPKLITISNVDKPLEQDSLNVKLSTNSNVYSLFGVLITFQVLAFETAIALGRNVDKPVGLNKIVK